MRITVTCPYCNKKSQIDEQYKGKKLRCPYPECRNRFRLTADGEALPIATEAEEAAPPPRAAAGPQVADWQAAAPPPQVADWQAAPPPEAGGYDEPATAGNWEQPAEEVVEYAGGGGEEGEYEEGEEESDYSYYEPVRKSKAPQIVVGLLILGILASAGAYGYLRWMQGKKEAEAFAKANEQFEAGQYKVTAGAYKDLQEKFPNSKEVDTYEYMAKLSELLAADPADTEGFIKRLEPFLKEYRGKAAYQEPYKKHQRKLWMAVSDAAQAAAEGAKGAKTGSTALANANKLNELTRDVASGMIEHQAGEIAARQTKLEATIAEAGKIVGTQGVIARLMSEFSKLEAEPGQAEEAMQLYDSVLKTTTGVQENADVQAKLAEFRAKEPGLVRYVPADGKQDGAPAPAGEGASLLVCPLLQGTPAQAPADDRVMLALAPGLVYGLAQTSGEVRWATRIGFDTHTAPVRLPARAGQPELALVLSAELNTLSAVDTKDGKVKWTFRLDSPCMAGPIIAGTRAFLPAREGKVYEIDLTTGKVQGHFEVANKRSKIELTTPGVYDASHNRLYVPASARRIFILNTAERKCEAVLYTNHTVGGLRGAPVVAPAGRDYPATLILAEAVGLTAMKIRAFEMPDDITKARELDADGRPLAEAKDPRQFEIPGWSWFPPYYDGDNLGFLTDRGYLALFGLKRGDSRDPALFPLVKARQEGGRESVAPLPVGDRAGMRPIGPAQIAHVDLQQWWLLVDGKLLRYHFDLYRRQLMRVPDEPPPLGSPLQAGQSILRGRGVALVTQAPDRALATAYGDSIARPLWQRQLGLVAGVEPVAVGDHLVVMDKKGGLLHLEQGSLAAGTASWKTGGEWLAGGLEEAQTSYLLPGPQGAFAVALIYTPSAPLDRQLWVRKFEPGKGLSEHHFPLESPPLGTPAVCGTSVVVPCRDGNLREFPLGGAARLPVPFAWRDPNLETSALGHAAFLADTHLLVSDGGKKIQQWKRDAAGQVWRKLDESLELNGRVASPLMVGPAEGGALIGAADDRGEVYLFNAATLSPVQNWRLSTDPANPVKVTRGPFLRGNRIGCVVDQTRLYWFDPAAPQPAWKEPYTAAEPGIMGEPRLVGNHLLVAEIGGGYAWLDPETGAVKGRDKLGQGGEDRGGVRTRLRVPTLVTPAAGAAALGQTTAIAPLNDGTFLILTPPAGAAAAQ